MTVWPCLIYSSTSSDEERIGVGLSTEVAPGGVVSGVDREVATDVQFFSSSPKADGLDSTRVSLRSRATERPMVPTPA